MSHFYIVLSSDKNSASCFKTKLSTPISLDGDWEVGLATIDFPHDWYTFGPNETICTTLYDSEAAFVSMPQGYYGDPRCLVDVMERKFNMLQAHYEESTGKMLFVLPPGMRMTTTAQLRELLGLEDIWYENPSNNVKMLIRPKRPYKKELIHTLYVYCDLVEKNVVGDVMVPLLALCDSQGNDGESVHLYYKTPKYLPPTKARIRLCGNRYKDKHWRTRLISLRTFGGNTSFQTGERKIFYKMRRPYICCSATDELFRKYYGNQVGNGLPIFVGSRGQRGHGLGRILGGLFRSALPMIKRGLSTFGKHALRTGLEIANDVADGQEFKQSARRRVPQGIKRFAQTQDFIPQSGRGKRRVKRIKRQKIDIF